MMTSNPTTKSRMQTEIIPVLSRCGWHESDGAPLALKEYEIRGRQYDAQVYFSDLGADDPFLWLHGWFCQDVRGLRNVLEPHGLLIPRLASKSTVQHLVARFCRTIDEVILSLPPGG